MEGPSSRTSPPTIGWTPPHDFKSGDSLAYLSADAIRAIQEQLALMSRIPREPGIYGAGIGWHPDGGGGTSGGIVNIVAAQLLQALPPGSLTRPGKANAKICAFRSDDERWEIGSESSITGKIFNILGNLAVPINGTCIAVHVSDENYLVITGSC